MTAAAEVLERFDPSLLAGLDEPVRRYFAHALADGAPLNPRVRLQMPGRIRVGMWLRFDSVWEGDGRSLSWHATCGPGPLRVLRVHDEFAAGAGVMDIRLRPGLRLLHAASDDVARSGAGRAAIEALWTPASLLPRRGVEWRAESDALIVAVWDVPPERPELHVLIGPDGSVRSYSAERWSEAGRGYVPFGADVHAEHRFGGITIPSRITAGWGYGTAAWSPFWQSEIAALQPLA